MKMNHFLSFFAVAFIALSFFFSGFQYSIFAVHSSQEAAGQVTTSMNYTFTWGPETQGIVDGTFTIEVSICLENITNPWNITFNVFHIVIKVYDDDFGSDDYLGLILDNNHNGVIDFGSTDYPRLIYADNSTIRFATLLRDGRLGPAEVPREKTYTCTYDTDKGYTFGPYTEPTSDFVRKFGDGPTYIPIYICFLDTNRCSGIRMVSMGFIVYLG